MKVGYLKIGCLMLALCSCGAMAQQPAQPSKEITDLVDKANSLPLKDRPEEGKKIVSRARELKDKAGEGFALSAIANWLLLIPRPNDALPLLTDAITIYHSLGDRASESGLTVTLGAAYAELNQYDRALDLYAKGLALAKECGDHSSEGLALSNIAATYRELGQPQKALDYDSQALSLFRKFGDPENVGTTLSNIGYLYIDLGQRKKALDTFEEALKTFRSQKLRREEAIVINAMATIYYQLAQYQEALKFLNEALPIRIETGDKAGEAWTLNSLGAVNHVLKHDDKAKDYYLRALAAHRAAGNVRGESLALENLGVLFTDADDPRKALEYFEQGVQLSQRIGDKFGEAHGLYLMGAAYRGLKDFEKSQEVLSKALVIRREIEDQPGLANAYAELALTLKRMGQTDAAIVMLKKAVNGEQALRADIAKLPANVQRSFKEHVANDYRGLADLLVKEGRLGEGERVLGLLRDDERFEFLRRDPAIKSLLQKVEYVGKEQGWLDKWEKIQDRAVAIGTQITDLRRKRSKAQRDGSTFAEEERLKNLESESAVVDKAMAAYYSEILADSEGQKKLLAAEKERELVEFRNNVGEPLGKLEAETHTKVAAIYTVSADSSVHFIIATPQGASPMTVNADPEKVNKLSSDLRLALTHPQLDAKAPGLALYNLLFKKVCDQLKAAKIDHVMWTLDGSLRYIPLPALWTGSHYLVEEESVTIYSPLELSKLTSERDQKPKVAGFGASKGATVGDREFSPLPNVRGEVESVVKNSSKHSNGVVEGVPWIDGEFTQDTLLSQLGDPYYQIAHLASHFDLRGDFEKSALLTGDGKLVTLKTILGGAGSLEEAQRKKPWSHLDLVVLSACDTAEATGHVGAGSGAEAESFASVVLSLGASSVMASLWSVSDSSTGILMKKFYNNWVSGMTKADALRQAQLAMLHGKDGGFSHPFYWAPFLIYGNWR